MSVAQAKAKPKPKAAKPAAVSGHNRNGEHQIARQKTTTPARLGAFYAAGPAFSLSASVQTKLTVSPPDDAYEKEADQVAETVMRMPQPDAATPPDEKEEPGALAQTKPLIQRQKDWEEEEEQPLQTKACSPSVRSAAACKPS